MNNKFLRLREKDENVFGRKKKMSVLLKDFLEEIGVAICNANKVIEGAALTHYMQQGYMPGDSNDDTYRPITFNMKLSDGETIKKVPVTALQHNTTMKLERVDLKLKLNLFEDNGEIKVDYTDKGKAFESQYDEISLQFVNNVPPEGVSRVTDNYLKKI